MIKYFALLFCVSVVGVSCLKSNGGKQPCPYVPSNVVAPQSEQDTILAYLDSNNLIATKHPSGFYYNIITPGTPTDSLELCTQVAVDYQGGFTNGTIFDDETDIHLVLGASVVGWQKGIPMIGIGGEIILYIPPSLAYGTRGVIDNKSDSDPSNDVMYIPPNATLIFRVKFKDYLLDN